MARPVGAAWIGEQLFVCLGRVDREVDNLRPATLRAQGQRQLGRSSGFVAGLGTCSGVPSSARDTIATEPLIPSVCQRTHHTPAQTPAKVPRRDPAGRNPDLVGFGE